MVNKAAVLRSRTLLPLLYPMGQLYPEDVPYEEDLLRTPHILRCWLRYIGHLLSADRLEALALVYERAIAAIPYSYKLWTGYLAFAEVTLEAVATFGIYERALLELPRFPRLWVSYAAFVFAKADLCRVELVLDRALRALPITQHDRVWDFYKERYCRRLIELRGDDYADKVYNVYSRWLQLHPEKRDVGFARKLIDLGLLEKAAGVLSGLEGDEPLDVLLELLAEHPDIEAADCSVVLRRVIDQKSAAEQVAVYWNLLATSHATLGRYATAKAVFEEALASVRSLADFCPVYEAYTQFLLTMASKSIEDGEHDAASLWMARIERVLRDRKLFVTELLLRDDPSKRVDVWLERIDILADAKQKIKELEKAIAAVSPRHSEQCHQLYLAAADLYARSGDYGTARQVLEHAASAKARLQPEDHAQLVIGWSKFELSASDGGAALSVLEGGAEPGSPSHRSAAFWNYFLDHLEALDLSSDADPGLVGKISAAYQRLIELKLATAQSFINYSDFLTRKGLTEKAFAVYERGIAAISWPACFDLWNIYLPKAVAFYCGEEGRRSHALERMRDLFEQCLLSCSDAHAAVVLLMYCDFEDRHGQPRNILRIAEKAMAKRKGMHFADKAKVLKYVVKRAMEVGDLTSVRAVFDQALTSLADDPASRADICLQYAHLEASQSEVPRARALYAFGAQLLPVEANGAIWEQWAALEQELGDEVSYREMLRVKRGVEQTHKMSSRLIGFVKASLPPPASG